MAIARAQPLVISNIIFFILAAAVVALRVYTRRFVVNTFGLDDVFAILAVMAFAALTGLHMAAVHYGMGRPIATLSEEQIVNHARCLWAIVAVYNLSLTFCKTSIVLQYMRVFRATSIQWISKVFLGIVILYGCWSVLGSIFMCWPVSYFWTAGSHDENGNLPEGKCLNKLAFWFSNAGLNILTDILITIIPLPFINGLHVPTRQKIALIGVFCIGSLVFVMSCVRLKGLYIMSTTTDPTYDGINIAIWSNIEVGLAIICAAAPPLKPLFSKFFPGLLSSASPTTAGGGISGPSRPTGTGYARQTTSRNHRGSGPDDDDDDDDNYGGAYDTDSRPIATTKGIQVHQTITMGSEKRRPSNAGSDECELVAFKADCYPTSRGGNDDAV